MFWVFFAGVTGLPVLLGGGMEGVLVREREGIQKREREKKKEREEKDTE